MQICSYIYGFFHYFMVVGSGEKLTFSLNAISTQIHSIMCLATDAGIPGAVISNNDRAGRAEGGGGSRCMMLGATCLVSEGS